MSAPDARADHRLPARPVPPAMKRLGLLMVVAAAYFGFAMTFEPQRSQAREAEQHLHDSILKTRPAQQPPLPVRLAGE